MVEESIEKNEFVNKVVDSKTMSAPRYRKLEELSKEELIKVFNEVLNEFIKITNRVKEKYNGEYYRITEALGWYLLIDILNLNTMTNEEIIKTIRFLQEQTAGISNLFL